MAKKQKPSKKVVFLNDWKRKITSPVKCKICLYGYVASWYARIPIDDVRCPRCANQSLEVVQLTD